MGKEFDAIVLVRIVGSGDDDANVEIVVADEASNAGSSENSGKRDGSAALRESRSDYGGNVGAGFAGIGANEGVRRGVIAMEIFSYRAAEGKDCGVVKGRNPWDAADAVGAKELSGHKSGKLQD